MYESDNKDKIEITKYLELVAIKEIRLKNYVKIN